MDDTTNENFTKHLEELLSLTKIGTWDWEIKTGKVVYSETWAQVLGYKKEELPQTVKTWESRVLPEDLEYANEQIMSHFRGEKPVYEAEFRMVHKDGTIIWAQDRGTVSEWDQDGKPVRFVGVLQDISRLKKAELGLKENQTTLDLAMNVAELGTWDWDIPGNKIRYNGEYLHMLGYSQRDMDCSLEEWTNMNHPEDRPGTIRALEAYIAGETQRYECEIRMKHKAGHYIWTRDVGRIVERDADGTPTRVIGGHLNIDALKRSQEQLNKLAYYDELTGVPNLVKFKIEAKKILESNPKRPFVFAKMDIVNFKVVNDIFGTEVGDRVIKKVAELVLFVRKRSKIELGCLARIHDDTFIVLDESFGGSVDEINLRTQMFEDAFNWQMAQTLGNHRIKFRYGRYFPQIGDTDVENAIECTALALSRAKANALTGTFDFDLSVKRQMRREVEITNRMQQALDNNEFKVFLQGKYSLIDESLCGAESLVRWQIDENTIIPPGEFIPLFEQNGFVTKLDMFMFTQCCALLAAWREQGITLIPISVNFSRKHLANPDFADDLAGIAKRFQVEPGFLEIELTETIVMDGDNDLVGFIAALHRHGFQMSIDDFGTGYSSLGMLKNLNIDSIKLDRSFFVEAQENVKAHSVLSNMISMIIDLGIKTVAEGVEEKAHVDLLRKLNCDAIQGYYYARPIPVTEFTRKIHNEVNTETLNALNDKTKRFNLLKNNELLMDMMDSMPLAFTLWDKSISVVQCNREAATLVGLSTEVEMISRLTEVIPEFQPDGQPSLPTIAARIQLAFENGYGRYTAWHFLHIDGTPLPCEVTLVRIVNKGEFMVACYVRDMRLQIEAENHIQQEYSKLQALIDATPMGIALWDKDINMLMCNYANAELFRFKSRQDYLDNFFDFSPEFQPCGRKSKEFAIQYIVDTFRTGYSNFTWMHQRRTGEPLPAEVTLVRIEFGDNPVVAGFTRDMRKQIADGRRNTKMLSRVLDHMNSMTYVVEQDTFNILYENQAMIAFAGEKNLGKHCYEAFRGESEPCEVCPMKELSMENPKSSIEYYNKKFDMFGKAMGSFVEWTEGQKAGLINVTDISEYKQLLDATPLCVNLWNSQKKLVMCNQAAYAMFDIESERTYLDRFYELSPEYQPDGKKSREEIQRHLALVHEKERYTFPWMHQKLSGELVPTEITIVEFALNGETMVATFVRELDTAPPQ